MALPPYRDQTITLGDASACTRRYRQSVKADAEKGGFFFREVLDKILAQKGCAGVRYYHGKDEKGEPSLIVVGVDGDGNDMTGGMLLNFHYPCPPFCGDGNTLNA